MIIKIETGYLFTDAYSKGELETLSIGDYGRRWNVKADFLGYNREIHGVPDIGIMPLSEKWVITVSTQYGCSMSCQFCDVPAIRFGGNATFDDLKEQLYRARALFPEVTYTERLNLHFARMGEPILNKEVIEFAKWLHREKRTWQSELGLRVEVLHPVLSTMLPKAYKLAEGRLHEWCELKNVLYSGQAGLQISINSTNEEQRNCMFKNRQTKLIDIASLCHELPEPLGRKYCLNFAYATGFEVDAKKLVSLFDPEKFMVKITPIHNNNACRRNTIETVGGYDSYTPYREIENNLIAAGFDVIVFIPSLCEEKDLVTCGNAILSQN